MSIAETIPNLKDLGDKLDTTLVDAIDDLCLALARGHGEPSANLRRSASLLVAGAARALAAAADRDRDTDARTFEAMLDVNAASSHFQSALDLGVKHAAQDLEKDGYHADNAMILASSRALDAIADLLKPKS